MMPKFFLNRSLCFDVRLNGRWNIPLLVIPLLLCSNTNGQTTKVNYAAYEHHTIPIQDGILHYQTIGHGPTILLSNGGPGWTCEHIESLGRGVAELGYQMIIYDQRGTGQSTLSRIDSTTITMQKMIADMERLRNHLKLEKWIVMGHSFGSMLSAMYASRFPKVTEKLILLSPPGTDLEFLSDYQDNLNKRLSPEQLKNLSYWTSAARMTAEPEQAAYEQVMNTLPAFIHDKSKLPILEKAITKKTYSLPIGQLVWSDLFETNYYVTEDVKRFKNRCLIVAGRQDALPQQGFEQVAKQFLKSELHWIDECAHALWVDQPDKLYAIVGKFLKAS